MGEFHVLKCQIVYRTVVDASVNRFHGMQDRQDTRRMGPTQVPDWSAIMLALRRCCCGVSLSCFRHFAQIGPRVVMAEAEGAPASTLMLRDRMAAMSPNREFEFLAACGRSTGITAVV